MQLFTSDTPLVWGELDLPVLGIASDWHGAALNPPIGFTIATDSANLWFVATRHAATMTRPGAEPGSFVPGLWEYDVAELFIGDPKTGSYLELNLAPNGAWWAAKFGSPRVFSDVQPDFVGAVSTRRQEEIDDGWFAAIIVPIAFLREEIGFGLGSTANATFIMNSPEQTFHSACKLPGAEPDFHQPAAFPRLIPVNP